VYYLNIKSKAQSNFWDLPKFIGGERMTQKLGIGNLFGSGIIGVLFVAGIGMWILNIPFAGIAIFLAILIAIIYGLLGMIGIGKRLDLIS
jgi:Ca2+/Na+ antiporter